MIDALQRVYSILENAITSKTKDDVIDAVKDVAEGFFVTGTFTVACWGLSWVNERYTPIGIVVGFLGRRPIHWLIQDLKKDKLTKSSYIVFIPSSLILTGIATGPVLKSVGVFMTSAYLGKFARDKLFPMEES